MLVKTYILGSDECVDQGAVEIAGARMNDEAGGLARQADGTGRLAHGFLPRIGTGDAVGSVPARVEQLVVNSTSCAVSFVQHAALAALENPGVVAFVCGLTLGFIANMPG